MTLDDASNRLPPVVAQQDSLRHIEFGAPDRLMKTGNTLPSVKGHMENPVAVVLRPDIEGVTQLNSRFYLPTRPRETVDDQAVGLDAPVAEHRSREGGVKSIWYFGVEETKTNTTVNGRKPLSD